MIIEEPVIVSISCAAFNHRKFIECALKGFIAQHTSFKYEILIHDDASTDGTADIIKQYENKAQNLIFPIYQTENQFLKGVRPGEINMRRAKGKYIAICEGDDYWTDPLKLQMQVDFLEANPDYSMCFHKARVLDQEGLNRRWGLYDHLENRDYTGRDILQKWTVPTASVVYRAELIPEILKIDRHPDILFGDTFLFLALAEFGKIRCINEEMSVYRIHGKSMTNIDNSIEHKTRFIKHQKALQQSFGGKYRHVTDDVIANTYLGIAGDWVKTGSFHKAVSNFFKALYYSPGKTFSTIIKKIANK